MARRPSFPSKQPGYKKPFPISSPMHPETYRRAHIKSDVDQGPLALHHTLGKGAGQAAPGKETDARLKGAENRLDTIEGGVLSNAGSSWSSFTPENTWTIVTVAKFKVIGGVIHFAGRIDFGASSAAPDLIAPASEFGETGGTTRFAIVPSTSTPTGGTVNLVMCFYNASGLTATVLPGGTRQRYLHLDGLHFAWGPYAPQ